MSLQGTPSYSPVEEVEEHNTFKQFYYNTVSDEEDTTNCVPYYLAKKSICKRPRSSLSNIDEFFPEEPPKKKKAKNSSNVGRMNKEGGTSYISTNTDDGVNATHLIKIDVFDVKKLCKIPPVQHWKHADVRVKYYCKELNNKNYESVKKIVYQITKEISESEDSKVYSFKNNN